MGMDLMNFNWVSKNPIPGTPSRITAGSLKKDGFLYMHATAGHNFDWKFPIERLQNSI